MNLMAKKDWMKYCFQCNKVFYDNNPHNNFCSWTCQNNYELDRQKWERLRAEKEKDFV